jgi:hypothetical protein
MYVNASVVFSVDKHHYYLSVEKKKNQNKQLTFAVTPLFTGVSTGSAQTMQNLLNIYLFSIIIENCVYLILYK